MRGLSQNPAEDLPRRVPLELQPGPGETLDLMCGGRVQVGRKDITGLELQPRLFSLAERNVYRNRCEREVYLVQGDLRRVGTQFAAGRFAHVLCNPPYRTRASGRSSVSMEKAIARHELACELQDVVRAADQCEVGPGTRATPG
ncbi:hypothetical protein [Myxococcus sp. CA018]|uniref:hypothetical protein n=2 Tax=Myxococcaceae TaxID=31 RepID=UPI001142AB78|nr:hypothetical protein [Myxococcus sp. CA018]NOK03982.1 hypothetical protein [Myxococcus xanthus]